MYFVRYLEGESIRRGVLKNGYVYDLSDPVLQNRHGAEWSADFLETPLEQWLMVSGVMDALRQIFDRDAEQLPQARSVNLVELLPPIDRPGKVIAAGLNYPPAKTTADFLPPPYPILFHKAATSLTGHGGRIILPKISQEVDFEGELAVVIGRKARQLSVSEAMDCVAGITIANDIGAKDIERRSSQWTSGKMFDTFCPLGPALVTPDEVEDLASLRILTHLNQEIVQDALCGEMIFNVPTLISCISELTTLMPGDLILTGSPKTVGESPAPNSLLHPGDIVQITIDPLGMLVNQVVKEE